MDRGACAERERRMCSSQEPAEEPPLLTRTLELSEPSVQQVDGRQWEVMEHEKVEAAKRTTAGRICLEGNESYREAEEKEDLSWRVYRMVPELDRLTYITWYRCKELHGLNNGKTFKLRATQREGRRVPGRISGVKEKVIEIALPFLVALLEKSQKREAFLFRHFRGRWLFETWTFHRPVVSAVLETSLLTASLGQRKTGCSDL